MHGRLTTTWVAAAIVLIGSVSLGCTSSADDGAPTTEASAPAVPDGSAPAVETSGPPTTKPSCAVPSLSERVLERYPTATLDHIACRDRQAVVTILGVADFAGEGVGFLISDGETWSLRASGPVSRDPSVIRPAEIRDDIFAEWQRLDAPLPTVSRPPRQPTSSTTTTTAMPGGCDPADPTCVGE